MRNKIIRIFLSALISLLATCFTGWAQTSGPASSLRLFASAPTGGACVASQVGVDATGVFYVCQSGTWAVGGGGGGSSGANPTATIGLTAVNGSATTFLRSDGAPALSQAIAPTWTGAHLWSGVTATVRRDAIGTTTTDGYVLENTTAAAAGAQQYSPRLRLTGQGWKTNATAASQTVDWVFENQPVQGTANPTSNLVILNQINGGGYSAKAYLTSGGVFAIEQNAGGAGQVGLAAAYGQLWVRNLANTSYADFAAARGEFFAGGTTTSVARINTDVDGINVGSARGYGISSATSADAASPDIKLVRQAANVFRISNGSTGAGSLVLGTSTVGSIGTSGVGVLAVANGTAPSSSPADEFQIYSADSAAGDANAFARNEAGEINRLTGLSARVSTQFDKTSDTTLANVTGLTRNVEAGRTYAFTAVIYTTSNVAGGVKAAIGGTATATSIIYQAEVLDGSTLATMGTARATALGTTVADVTAVTSARITITGTIVVNAAGTLVPQFAQNTSNGSASSVLVNSSFQLIPIS